MTIQHNFNGSAAGTSFSNCTFKRNKPVKSEKIANNALSQHELESRIVDVDSMQVFFSSYVSSDTTMPDFPTSVPMLSHSPLSPKVPEIPGLLS